MHSTPTEKALNGSEGFFHHRQFFTGTQAFGAISIAHLTHIDIDCELLAILISAVACETMCADGLVLIHQGFDFCYTVWYYF